MSVTIEVKTTAPSKEGLIRKIMFVLNAPAQRMATMLNAAPRVRCQKCERRAPLHKGDTLNPHFGYTCPEHTPSIQEASLLRDAREEDRRKRSRERARRWREKNPERAAEYKRRQRHQDSYGHMSPEKWETILKEFGFACSTPSCGRPLNLKTAIHSAEGPTYVPICRSCRGRKAAKNRWEKEKRAAKAYAVKNKLHY